MDVSLIWRRGFRTIWCAAPVSDFDALAPYKGLVAVTCELSEKHWLAQELPRGDYQTWLQIWRACEQLYLRVGATAPTAIVALEHRPRERVLVATFGPAAGDGSIPAM